MGTRNSVGLTVLLTCRIKKFVCFFDNLSSRPGVCCCLNLQLQACSSTLDTTDTLNYTSLQVYIVETTEVIYFLSTHPLYTYARAHTPICMYICTYVCMYVYIYIYKYIYI